MFPAFRVQSRSNFDGKRALTWPVEVGVAVVAGRKGCGVYFRCNFRTSRKLDGIAGNIAAEVRDLAMESVISIFGVLCRFLLSHVNIEQLQLTFVLLLHIQISRSLDGIQSNDDRL